MKKTTTVLFDMDGTLLDTEKYFRRFWKQAAAVFGYQMSDEQVLAVRSLGRPYAPEQFAQWFGEGFDYYAVRECRRKLMQEHLEKVGLETKSGAEELLLWLKENGCQSAVVTATSVERAREQLGQVGLLPYLGEIVSAAEAEHGKPAPDAYLCALKKLEKEAEECLAVEDSPNGVLSAYRAGIRVVMVPDLTEPDEELRGKLYACVPNLLEIKRLLQ